MTNNRELVALARRLDQIVRREKRLHTIMAIPQRDLDTLTKAAAALRATTPTSGDAP